MPSPNFDPLPRKLELASIAFLQFGPPAAIAGLRWFPLVDNDLKQNPRGVSQCFSCHARPKMAARGVSDAVLKLWIVSNADDDTAQIHEARVGAVVAMFNDRAAVKAALNAPRAGQPDTRTVRDLHLYECLMHGSEDAHGDNKWISKVELALVCQGKDVILT